MNLPKLSVEKPVTTAMIFIASLILGFVALSLLGIDFMPDLEIPAVSVITTYEGAGPEEVEKLVTEPLEDSLSTVSGVDEITSTSIEGRSTITLKFAWGEEIDEKANDVRDKMDLAKSRLPDEAEDPIMFKFDLSMSPIMILVATAQDSYPDLQKIVKDKILDQLKQVPGVAAATSRGGLTRQIRIDLDKDKLTAYGLSVSKIQAILAAQNLSIPGGNVKAGFKDYLVRTPEEFSNPAEVANVVVADYNGMIVRLKDVAEVSDSFKERTYGVRINKEVGIGIMIQKQSGTNTVEIAKKVREEISRIEKTLPADVKLKVVVDNSEFIIASVNNLRNTLFWAIAFVFIVILILLRDIRASVIIAISIPTSLVITFVLMWLAGYTINQNTLASLAIAVGMVVDNAIVVVDNIQHHRLRGRKAKEGAIFGTSEVGVAVMASTLTTIAIFAPIIFVGGIARVVFGEFAAIITMALLASLVTALMLVPMMCSKFMRGEHQISRFAVLNFMYDWGETFLAKTESAYASLLDISLKNRKTVLLICVLLIVVTIPMIKLVGSEFFPEEDQNRISATYELPIGTRFERTGVVARKLQDLVDIYVPEKQDSFIRWGVFEGDKGNAGMGFEEASYLGFMMIRLSSKTQRDRSPKQIIQQIRPIADQIPGAKIRFSSEDPLMSLIFGGGRELAVDIYGYDLKEASEYANRVASVIASIKGVTDVDISRKEQKPELKVVVNREKASAVGLNVSDIGKTIETLFAGTTATKYREGGDEYDIEIRLRPEDRTRIEDLGNVFITTPAGISVPLANIAQVDVGYGPTKIERKNQARIITITADVTGRDLGSVVGDVEKAVDKIPRPPSFDYKFAGAEKEKRDAFRLLVGAAVLGMILVYMVMASQFESYRDPFIIFLSVPFGLVGVVMGLALTGQRMSVITFIALIMMVGIVVNNGIVLISYIAILRQRGKSIYEAVVEGGRSRLRPILGTTLTTVLGLIPLAISRGEGSEIWLPFSVTLLGGLSVSTVVTLILMPTLYSMFEGLKRSDIGVIATTAEHQAAIVRE